ncbi:WYL domain-containing protein [Arthrobacter ginkgonis]|uniref:WYL domain-containing protein n=1 Tax=Arthrobacter ginkgonis TaxID=1630594 RepID=A0ABP7CIY5_9MICC
MPAKRIDDAPSRTEKLVSLTYALLYRKRGYSRAELREIVDDYRGLGDEAFERKFERDKEDLRQLGIPVETLTEDGFFDGDRQLTRYRILPEKYRLPPVAFDPAEAAALALASKVWKDPALGTAASRAANRMLLAGLLDAEAAFEGHAARLHAGDAVFTDVLRAAWEEAPIRFTYRAVDGTESRRRVEPWGVGSRFGNWYLVGLDRDRGEERMFRLSRITSDIARLGGTMKRPEGFRIAEHLDRLDPASAMTPAAADVLPGRGLALRIAAADDAGIPALPAIGLPGTDGPDAGTADGRESVAFRYHDAEAAAAELAELGPAARVTGPPELRDAVVHRLRAALQAQRASRPAYQLKPSRSGGRPAATKVVARALDIVAFVVRHGAPTVEETAAHFGLTKAALLEDLAMIRMCGVPNGLPDELIEVEWETGVVTVGNAEGLADPVRLNLLEAFSLTVGLQAILDLPDTGERTAVASALAKLTEAAGEFGQLGRIVSTRLASAEDGERTAVLADAVRARSVLRLEYHNRVREEITVREVEPVRLLEDGGRTYLQAWCRQACAPRNFRTDRILGATASGETFEAGERHAGVGEALYTAADTDAVVVLAFSARLGRIVDDYAPTRTAALAGGGTAAEVRIAAPEHLPGLVARHGGEVAVLEPAGHADAVAGWLESALALYGKEGL